MHKLAMMLCVMSASLTAQGPNHRTPGLPRTPDGKPRFRCSSSGRGTGRFSWYRWYFPPIRWPKSWSRSRRLLYTSGGWEVKMEISGE